MFSLCGFHQTHVGSTKVPVSVNVCDKSVIKEDWMKEIGGLWLFN